MKVSVIVPIYKVEKEISRCLVSVIQQKYENIELVLVDDCTPDDSFKIAESIIIENQFRDKTIFVRHGINEGISAARNAGLNASTGEYVFFLDSDDSLVHSGVIAELVSFFVEDESLDLVISDYQRIVNNRPEMTRGFLDTYLKGEAIYEAYISSRLEIMAWGKLIKRSFLLGNGIFFDNELSCHEDQLWSYKVFRAANKIYCVPLIVYNYFERAGSITYISTKKNTENLIKATLKMYELYLEEPSYYKKQTILKIEMFRRLVIEQLFSFSDRDYIEDELIKLKTIDLPMFGTRKFSVFKQNLLLRMPIRCILFIYSLRRK